MKPLRTGFKAWRDLTGDERVAVIEKAVARCEGFPDETAHVRSALQFSSDLRRKRAAVRAKAVAYIAAKRREAKA